MAPRQSPARAWYSSALDSPNVSEVSLARLRRMAVAQGINGAKVLKAGSATPEGQGSTFNPFFVSAIAAGLVPPFSKFFFSVLRHYKLQALHLHPNSVLLLTIFAYYCEAHIGVQPSVAMLRHYFYLQTSRGPASACTSFIRTVAPLSFQTPGKGLRASGASGSWQMLGASTLG